MVERPLERLNMVKKETQVVTAFRLGESILARIDKLAASKSTPGMQYTRTDMLRMIVHRGVEAFESERKKKEPR